MKPRNGIRADTIFQLARPLECLPESLKLRRLEWRILFAMTGNHTVAEIGEHLGLTADERDEAFARLMEACLIRERELSYREYVRAAAAIRGEELKPLAQSFRGGIARGGQAPAPRPPGAGGLNPAPPPAPFPESRIVRADFAQKALRHLSLKKVTQLILNRAPDLSIGQFDVYRVLIQVDTKLLKRHGITCLRFQEDHLISDPELQQAILSNVRKTLGFSCPRDVFVS